ncbi:MAG: IS21 family transposase [Verrucomicrobiota bacterium]
MIDYQTYVQIHALHREGKLNAAQIARELGLHSETVSKWLKRPSYEQRKATPRSSKLDPFKPLIVRMLERHRYTATQILNRLREEGYEGGYSILKKYVRKVRPPDRPAYLTLHFEPGECAQVDWGHAGLVNVGNTRRRLSFFVMVFCYSRMLYVEFTLAQSMEHFLACHQKAFEALGGSVSRVMVDNLKSAVLSHPAGGPVVFNPRYLDFANHYGFEIRACNVGAAHEKGRVENGVRYVRSSFLNGMDVDQFAPINPAARHWLDTVANLRVHGETRRRPIDLFEEERPTLQPLPAAPYDVGVPRPVTATSQFRVSFEANRYSVPSEYAGARLNLRVYPDKLLVYHEDRLVAEHARSYERRGDFLDPDHERRLLAERRKGREQQLLRQLLRISARAEAFIEGLQARRLNPPLHIRRIVALAEIYGRDPLAGAIDDAIEYHAFSAEYLANILEQRARELPEPGALHLTRREDLLELELPEPDLSIYDSDNPPEADQPHSDEQARKETHDEEQHHDR